MRVDKALGFTRGGGATPPPPVEFQPIWEPNMLPNGWSALPPPEILETMPKYPFSVQRTKNKPHGAVGFLPVYPKIRKDGTKCTTLIKKIKGDHDRFVQELRAVLQIPTPFNPKEDAIRIRAGGTVELDGNHVKQVKQWLAGLGF